MTLIQTFHTDILATMEMVSWSMAGLLVVFVLLALWVARQYDREGGTPDLETAEAVAVEAYDAQ